ncbi:MAG TPA: serine hydrolase domain-containing protein [Terriglobales bacterium]|nr:serine hydrolase domain-containing protein [Terriglobales bacterium]
MSFQRVLLLLFVIAYSLLTRAAAQEASQLAPAQINDIEKAITAFMAQAHAPSISVAVVKDGKLAWTGAYGFSDLENFVPATTSTMYRLASISKPITATAVMQLVQAGKIDLDAPAQKYCPAYPQKQWTITTRELLGHLAGVRHYKNPEEENKSTHHYSSVVDSLDFFKSEPLDLEPGTKFHYSTFGYSILGCEIEGVSGMSFMDYLQKNIFQPAGMTHIRSDDTYAIIPNRARGYRKTENGDVVNAYLADTSNKIPGGGLISTATDLADFAIASMHATLVAKATEEQMWTPQKTRDGKSTSYGLGWGIGELKGKRKIAHDGGQPGTSTDLAMLPDSDVAVAVMCNLEEVRTRDLADEILEEIAP